jgi:membrane-associated protease RseP (regulator of RpoE activity)
MPSEDEGPSLSAALAEQPAMAPIRPGLRAGIPRSRGAGIHLVLLAASFYTMTLAGALNSATGADPAAWPGAAILIDPAFLWIGVPYSLCLLGILGAHEMGHYIACRRYGVDATLPFFLPSIPVFGTFGAFIRIRSPIPDRKALFDIGVAGPLAGFVVALPVLALGLARAEIVPETASGTHVGVPLLMAGMLSWLSDVPDGQTIMLSGPLMAAWVGCLATAVNLFPIGQLDGGHICYAISPRLHRSASWTMLAAFVGLGLLVYPGWLFFATLLVLFGPRHPPLSDPGPALSRGRILVAAVALVILVLSFIPQPFDFSSL